jgi:hypothetical protein
VGAPHQAPQTAYLLSLLQEWVGIREPQRSGESVGVMQTHVQTVTYQPESINVIMDRDFTHATVPRGRDAAGPLRLSCLPGKSSAWHTC